MFYTPCILHAQNSLVLGVMCLVMAVVAGVVSYVSPSLVPARLSLLLPQFSPELFHCFLVGALGASSFPTLLLVFVLILSAATVFLGGPLFTGTGFSTGHTPK